MTVGERIKLRRKELGLTQEELGKKLGYKKSAVCRVEREENNITTDRIQKFAKALDTTPGYLMGWENAAGADLSLKITRDDEELLNIAHDLNSDGRRRLLEYASDLSKIESYIIDKK